MTKFTHDFDFDNIKILNKVNNEYKRKTGEMFFIKKEFKCYFTIGYGNMIDFHLNEIS